MEVPTHPWLPQGPQSTASREEAVTMSMGGTTYGSLDKTNGVITGNVSADRNTIIGTSNAFYGPDTWWQTCLNDYNDCLKRLGFNAFAKYRATHWRSRQQCIDGTCDWFLKLSQYRDWLSEKGPPLLLLVGNAGMGKTMLCHFLAEELQPSGTVAYFFCDYDPQRSRATAVLAGLLVQLLAAHQNKFGAILNDYVQHRESLPHDFDLLWTMFRSFLTRLASPVYLIIDGVDKCDESSRQDLFPLLSNVLHIEKVKILLASRSKPELPNMSEGKVRKVEQKDVSKELSQSVSRFINDRLQNLRVPRGVRDKVHDTVSARAGDTYLWAAFVLQDLDKAQAAEVDKKLRNLPRDLYEVYDRMLRDIDPSRAEEAAFVLRVTALACRPLTQAELSLLYFLRPGEWEHRDLQTLDEVEPHENPDLHTACKSLVRVDSDGAVSLVHPSAREYLLDNRLWIHYSLLRRGLASSSVYASIASFVGNALGALGLVRGISRYRISPDETHLLLLQICWKGLGARELEKKGADELDRVLASRPSLAYIVDGWQEHALAAARALAARPAWLAANLAKLPRLRDAWLHRAVQAGDVATARLLLDHGADPNAKGRLFDSPLEAAAASGDRAELVRLLLDRGAAVNVVPEGGGSSSCPALQAAASNGFADVVRVLLARGADANSVGGRYPRPLRAAARHGQVEVVRMLLDHGADVNAKGQGHAYALQGAACGGHLEVVKLLVERGADVLATGGLHGSAVEAARDKGHGDVERWLLEQGAPSSRRIYQDGGPLYDAALKGDVEEIEALLKGGYDVNTRGGKYGNALQVAAYKGHERVARLLVERGADVNAQGGKHGYSLPAAAFSGHERVVRFLVDEGADVNAQGGKYGNALQVAAYSGHESVVRLLVEKGADVDARGGKHGSPLQAAAFNGNKSVVQLLIEKGADVNAHGGKHACPLQAAAFAGNEGVVQLLIEKGADVDAQGGIHGNAMHAASVMGHTGTMEVLLRNGVSANARGGFYGVALAAATWSSVDAVRLLLDKGAHTNAKGGQYGSALQAAAYQGKVEMVKVLLENGANVNTRGGQYGSALQTAAYQGNVEMVKVLLENGARTNTEGGMYGSPLHAAESGGHKDVVQLLKKWGARDTKDGQGRHDTSPASLSSAGIVTSLTTVVGLIFVWRRLGGFSLAASF